MVNGNYIMYGDRPSSESEVVEDHVQTRTKERKPKRKSKTTQNEQSTSPKQQRDNETDSVKYEKKVKEPRLLRYVPNADVEENFVTEKFETYDLPPAVEERPKRHGFTKKPKNPSDGSVNYAFSRSSSSSPNGNLPTIAEYGEQYEPYRTRAAATSEDLGDGYYKTSLNKYFVKHRDNVFDSKLKYDGSHPDSLYRVPNGAAGLGDGKMWRMMRALRWPGALLLVCAALAGFVFFLMPANMDSNDHVNSTDWERGIASAGVRLPATSKQKTTPHRRRTTTTELPTTINPLDSTKKLPEIDFYDAETEKNYDLVSIAVSTPGDTSRPPIAPVFPAHLSPEVQYGDKDKGRTPKVYDDKNELPEDSTLKPHITQKPEKPLAIYFNDAGSDKSSEKVNRAVTGFEIKVQDKIPNGTRRPSHRVNIVNTQQSSSDSSSASIPITSGHSKIFGLGIEHLDIMKSTTQSSVYNTRVSPTLPTWRDSRESTTKHYPVNLNVDAPHCQSPHLALCRGVLPYDLAGPPTKFEGIDVTTMLSDINYLVTTNCSDRAKQFLCGVLEPECNPAPFPPKRPCSSLCKMVQESCEGFISGRLQTVFRCDHYEESNCNGARAPCGDSEIDCGNGYCVSREWACNGHNDCPNGIDEKNCTKCNEHQFFCESAGDCIEKNWMCDGIDDCPGREDESDIVCLRRELTSLAPVAQPHVHEPGEESAGSAPAPAVRRPNTLTGGQHRSEIRSDDSSKELLITSDSSNALKRNFTRRPSPSRLTVYKSKLPKNPGDLPFTRTLPPEPMPFDDEEKDATTKSSRKSNGPKNKVEPFVNMQKNADEEDDPLGSSGEVNRVETNTPKTAKVYLGNNTRNDYERRIDSSMLRKAAAEEAADRAERLRQPAPDMQAAEEDAREAAGAGGRDSPCPSGELRCVDGLCITLSQLCDGQIDCSDHADEDNCFT